MNPREEILGRLRATTRPAAPLPPWPSGRHYDDLAGQFQRALQQAHGEVALVASWEGAMAQLWRWLGELAPGRIVVQAEPPLDSLDWATTRPDISWFVVGQSVGDLRAFCAAADVGLSLADAALAETGSVVISSGPGKSRLATLLPPVHIAIVPPGRITTDLFTWTAARTGLRPANITLISGPSKTADIEQTMAIGVHGPKRFMVIVITKNE